jgi:hypothetical protein
VVPSAFFGMHIHRDPKWPGIGKAVGTERIWDTDAQWSAIYAQDPSAGGVPDWKAFNARVNRALLNGAELVMNLGGNAPAWATGDSPACGGASPIKSLDIWRTWVQAVATQAKGRIRYWEVWNEPYMCSALKANPALLATYVGEAYRILKQVDPSNVVLTPSFALGDQEYLDRYLQAAKAAYPSGEAFADVIAIHAYDNFAGTYLDDRVALKDPVAARSVEYMYDEKHLLLNSKVLLKKHGLENKPLWNTEAGYLGASSATGGPNDEAGAAFVARHLLLSWAAGFDRSIYYAWDQHSSVDPETKVRYFAIAGGREVKEGDQVYTTTAAGTAYAQVAKWLTGAELFSRQIDPTTGAWTLTLRRGPASSYVLWNPTGAPSSFNRPAGLTVLSDLAGVQTVSSTATVAVTPRPVLLAAPATSVSITTSAASIKVSKPVTFTAQVSGGSGPGGKVQFTLNGFNMGNPVALTNGKATLSTNAPSAPGSYAVGASYLGDAVNPPNKSSTLTETVIPLTCFGIICW